MPTSSASRKLWLGVEKAMSPVMVGFGGCSTLPPVPVPVLLPPPPLPLSPPLDATPPLFPVLPVPGVPVPPTPGVAPPLDELVPSEPLSPEEHPQANASRTNREAPRAARLKQDIAIPLIPEDTCT
jgi:hypothetical protein